MARNSDHLYPEDRDTFHRWGNRRYVGFRFSYLNVIIEGLSLMHQMSAPFKRMSSTSETFENSCLYTFLVLTSCPLTFFEHLVLYWMR